MMQQNSVLFKSSTETLFRSLYPCAMIKCNNFFNKLEETEHILSRSHDNILNVQTRHF
jgi:hypothetical protein